MDALEKFKAWTDPHSTHLNRFANIMHKQILSMGSWVELFHKYPVNSIEFAVEVKILFDQISELLDELKENNDDLAKDMEGLRDVFETFQTEIEQLPEEEE